MSGATTEEISTKFVFVLHHPKADASDRLRIAFRATTPWGPALHLASRRCSKGQGDNAATGHIPRTHTPPPPVNDQHPTKSLAEMLIFATVQWLRLPRFSGQRHGCRAAVVAGL
uniref:Uncharacterized protein n=1 Tax=Coccidioides posadasii RMSCC 3488 TaxID=454284 RepID=A0A0J6IJW0_COCPO|nr:hypothetical protein CPAG_08500 [Coccidioides posadasii RMSCC 3488]